MLVSLAAPSPLGDLVYWTPARAIPGDVLAVLVMNDGAVGLSTPVVANESGWGVSRFGNARSNFDTSDANVFLRVVRPGDPATYGFYGGATGYPVAAIGAVLRGVSLSGARASFFQRAGGVSDPWPAVAASLMTSSACDMLVMQAADSSVAATGTFGRIPQARTSAEFHLNFLHVRAAHFAVERGQVGAAVSFGALGSGSAEVMSWALAFPQRQSGAGVLLPSRRLVPKFDLSVSGWVGV